MTGGDGDDTLTGGADVDTIKVALVTIPSTVVKVTTPLMAVTVTILSTVVTATIRSLSGAGKDDDAWAVDIFVFSSGDTRFSAANQIDEILDFSLEDKIEATDQSVADITVPAGTLENGIYTFGDQNNPATTWT